MASGSIDVYIKLPSGKAFSSQHFPTDTVRNIAEYVGKKENIPENRVRIKYQGKTLDKTKTVGYLGICAETILKAEVVFPKELHIFVKFTDGTCNPFTVQTTDTVQQLKRTLEPDSGIEPNSQVLQFENGTTITGTTTLLCDTGIVDESVLNLKERVVNPAPKGGNSDDSSEEVVDEEKKQALMESFATNGRNIEVVFCFDTTGSMSSCIQQVRTNLRRSCERLVRDIPTIRIGIMAHGDYCDYTSYIVRYTDLTTNIDTLVDFADNVPATTGGDAPEVRQKLRASCSRLLRDIPRMRIGLMANGDYCDYEKYVVQYEDLTSNIDVLVSFADQVSATGGGGNGGECYEWALRKAQQLDWSEDSAKALVMIGDELPHVPSYTDQNLFWKDELDVLAGMGVKWALRKAQQLDWSEDSAKALVMIGDELPHVPSYTDQNLFWKDELDVLAGMGVKVYGVQAMHRSESDMFYEEMAERTGGYYLRLNNFSLITDMFLAVCYRESNAEQLDAFVEEVQNEGRMTEDTKLFLDKLEQEVKKPETRDEGERASRRYVAQSWWDRTLDKGSPEYEYIEDLDSFRPFRRYNSETNYSHIINTTVQRTKSRRSRFKQFVLKAFKRK